MVRKKQMATLELVTSNGLHISRQVPDAKADRELARLEKACQEINDHVGTEVITANLVTG